MRYYKDGGIPNYRASLKNGEDNYWIFVENDYTLKMMMKGGLCTPYEIEYRMDVMYERYKNAFPS